MFADGTIKLKLKEMNIQAASLGAECCVPDLLGENIIQNWLQFQLDEDDELYEGYGRLENAFPYRQYNQYDAELDDRKIKTAVLENQYLKATFLPEYGGRLWSLIDKTTGKNLLYTNDVLQFRNLAVRNAWFSGGVEWNVGIIGHTPFTTAPLYVGTLENEKGNAVLRMYEYERIRKIFYQMDFWLDEEDHFLNCRMRIVNDNETVVPMYWWSNIAVPEFPGGRIIVPAKKAYTIKEGKVIKVDIPYVEGVDVTHYNGIPHPVDYFFQIEDNSPKFIVHVDKEGSGLLQISTGRLRSRKLFTWGHNRASKHWQEYLTKEAGDYVEIQAGLAKTQYGCIPMAPHTAWEWIEQYGPVQLTKEQLQYANGELSDELSYTLVQDGRIEELEKKLQSTKSMAKTRCKLLIAGSGYGAFAKQRYSSHLEFVVEDERLTGWKSFMENGVLPIPDSQEVPDEFPIEDNIFRKLEETVHTINKENWYVHYQLGIHYCSVKAYEKAKMELKEAFRLKANAWACHALACVYYMQKENQSAIIWILNGLELEKKNVSYLKEMFKLLWVCGGYEEILQVFEHLEGTEQVLDRLRFYYITAKHKLGQDEEALSLLEQDGGLLMTDNREGEGSIQQLWLELNESVTGEKKEVPYRFLFREY